MLTKTNGGPNGSPTPAQTAAKQAPAVRAIDFTRASLEHSEPAFDESNTLTTGQQTIGPFDVPAFGFLRSIWLRVIMSGSAAGMATVAENPDAPWNVIASIALRDVNGANLVGPFTGYDLFLVNKWGGYDYDDDPTRGPAYTAPDSDGDFEFALRVPCEIVARNAYGALLNQNAGATYKVDITLAADDTIYSTSPDTLGTVRVKGFLEAWTPPSAADPVGNPQAQRPPGLGTTQYWSKYSPATSVGSNQIRLQRVGHFIRTLILVLRDDNNAREGADINEAVNLRVVLDGFDVINLDPVLVRQRMAELYGYDLAAITTADLDEGVYVLPFSHDFDGKPGGELGHFWLPTAQSTRLEVVLTTLNTAGTLDVITNDLAPVAVSSVA